MGSQHCLTEDAMKSPLNNLLYDWITILHAKAKGVEAYETYLKDAQIENSQECIDLLSRLRDQDARAIEEICSHISEIFGDDWAHVVAKGRRDRLQEKSEDDIAIQQAYEQGRDQKSDIHKTGMTSATH